MDKKQAKSLATQLERKKMWLLRDMHLKNNSQYLSVFIYHKQHFKNMQQFHSKSLYLLHKPPSLFSS